MSYVNNTLKNVPFENIIGGPLKAAINAQSIAAKATVDFIQQVGFISSNEPNESKDQDYGESRNIVFKYTTTNSDGTMRVAELSVPILTIVPIPYIRIDDMTIDFTANISEIIDENSNRTNTRTTDGGVKAVVPFYATSVGMKGSIS
jgi:hypothetical protein